MKTLDEIRNEWFSKWNHSDGPSTHEAIGRALLELQAQHDAELAAADRSIAAAVDERNRWYSIADDYREDAARLSARLNEAEALLRRAEDTLRGIAPEECPGWGTGETCHEPQRARHSFRCDDPMCAGSLDSAGCKCVTCGLPPSEHSK